MGRKIPTFVTQQEFEKIFDAEKDKEYKLAFLLSFEAGLRISEIVGLKILGVWKIQPLTKEQIDVNTNTIKIISGKGEKDRIVPLPKRVNKTAIELLPIKKSRRSLEWKINKLGKSVLGKMLHFHSLRHSFATHLVSKIRLEQVQVLMGHSNIATTGIYLHANPKEAVKGAIDAF